MLHNNSNFNENYSDESEDDYYLRIKSIDAKSDIFCTLFEKQLKRLPSNQKFIKKYVYYELLPYIEKMIDELEKIKETPNYDEKLPNIKLQSIIKTDSLITCMDLFDTHNIKNMRHNKVLYGTAEGTIFIYDLETQRIVCDKSLGVRGRVDIVATSTIKYFDAYLTRIAVTVRGDPNIYMHSYNHSFTVINSDCVITLKEGLQSDSTVQLSSIPASITFSKDSFFMSVTDYTGGVRIYKFLDIPQAKDLDKSSQTNILASNNSKIADKKDLMQNMMNFLPGKKTSFIGKAMGVESIANLGVNISNVVNLLNPAVNPFNLISYIKYKETENCTIIPGLKKEGNDDPNSKGKVGIQQSNKNINVPANQLNKGKAPIKDIKKDLGMGSTQSPADENTYNVLPFFDENGNDLSPLLKLNKSSPHLTFIQKKLIFEEKQSGGFTTCLITVGLYIAFYGSNNLKYVSLYSHISENMKSIFKVVKSRGGSLLSPEDAMSLSGTMAKKEKDYIAFIKTKLDSFSSIIGAMSNSVSSNMGNTGGIAGVIAGGNIGGNTKAKDKDKDAIPTVPTTLEQIATKSEINFTTLFPITLLIGQKIYNNFNNLLSVGMKDGTILVWDAELHVDKYLFQTERGEIVSMSIDENYLFSGSLDGQVHIYELIRGTLIYKSYHNAYRNCPIQNVSPFFSYLSLVIDTDQKVCVYSNKQKMKVGKLILENSNKNYKISYFNKNLVRYTDEYVVFICYKDKSEIKKNDLLEMIRFQRKNKKPVLEEFCKSPEDDFFNYYQNFYSQNNFPFTKSYLVVYKIKDIILKCFPQLIMVNKKGFSLKKIMKKYDINNIPSFDQKDNKISNMLFGENEGSKNKKFAGSSLKSVEERTENEKEKEKEKGNKGGDSGLERKESNTMDFALNEDDLRSMKYNLKGKLSTGKNDDQQGEEFEDLGGGHSDKIIAEENSTQKKNIIYYSFKNIRERYQFKEQRVNKIQMRNDKILKDLLPPVNLTRPSRQITNDGKKQK